MSIDPGNSVQPPAPEGLNKLRELLAKHLSVALSSMLGEQVEAEETSNSPAGDLYWFRQSFVPLEGSIWFGLTKAEVLLAGEKLLAAAGLSDEPPETAIETFGEILGQSSGALASDYASKLRKDVRTGTLESNVKTKPESANQFVLKITAGSDILLARCVVEGADLLSVLVPAPAQPAALSAAAGAAGGSGHVLEGVNARNLDLLLEVELPISVSFGRAQLALKDVIKLTTGSIVELNRAVSEPVDIIVNNCVIARGEVVVVEGNFGVRIKQIVSKQERLKTVT
jgi:flagellar motor switch protein FliN/FliY